MISYLPAFDQLSSLSRLNLGLSSLSVWQRWKGSMDGERWDRAFFLLQCKITQYLGKG